MPRGKLGAARRTRGRCRRGGRAALSGQNRPTAPPAHGSTSWRVGDIAKGELPLGEPEPGSGILGPKRRQLDLANSRRRSAGRRQRRLQFVVIHDGNSGSPMSLLVNGKTVEMRLVIFRTRISYIISQIYLRCTGGFLQYSEPRWRPPHMYIYLKV